MSRHYVIKVWGGIEPTIDAGPFDNESDQIDAAKTIHKTLGEESEVFWLDISEGVPTIGAFDPQTFEEVNP